MARPPFGSIAERGTPGSTEVRDRSRAGRAGAESAIFCRHPRTPSFIPEATGLRRTCRRAGSIGRSRTVSAEHGPKVDAALAVECSPAGCGGTLSKLLDPKSCNYSSQTGQLSSGTVCRVFGTLLKQARLNAAMTQEELAAKASVTREYVSLLERDQRNPTIEVFIRLVRAVGLSPAEVIADVEKSLPE